MGLSNGKELAAALRDRKISAAELMDHIIRRVEALDRSINAVVVRDFERAREAAKAADAALARGESGPLLGVPMTVKESFNIAGLPTTWGYSEFRTFKPKGDALAVFRAETGGRRHLRQDQRARGPERLAELQRHLRNDQ